jgi:cyanophycin synthetase
MMRELLERQGLALDSVAPAGRTVMLRLVSNTAAGGTSEDRTDETHPANRRMAERAAAAIGLDVCGVDFLTTDISEPYWDTGGAICELNSRPGLGLHREVLAGRQRDAHGPIVDMLFPDPARGRIPTVVVLTAGDSADFALAVAASFEAAGLRPGIWVLGQLRNGVDETVATIPDSLLGVAAIVRDGTVDAAVVQVPPAVVADRGLGLEGIDALALDPSLDASNAAVKALRAITLGAIVRYGDPAAIDAVARALRLSSTTSPH